MQKVRNEFEDQIQAIKDKNQMTSQSSKRDALFENLLTMETLQEDFQYLHWVMNEAFRLNPP